MPSFDDLKRINKANSIINRSNISIGLRPMYLHADSEPEEQEEYYEEEAYYEEDFDIEKVEIELDNDYEDESFERNPLSQGLRREIRDKLKETQARDIVTAEEYYLKKAQDEEQGQSYSEFYEEQNNFEPQQEQTYYYEPAQQNVYEEKRNFFDADELNSEPLFETAARAKASENFISQECKPQGALSFSKTVMYTAFAVIAAVSLIFTFKPATTAPVTKANFEETKLQELTKTVSSTEPRSLIITSGSFVKEDSAINYQKSLKSKLGVPLKLVKDGSTFSIQIGPAYANHDDALLVFDELSRYSVENLSIKVAS